jgi:trimethylamine---corrinoid protein Co-methyltransferase
MSFAELLTQEQVQRIHDASLEILEEVGLKVRYEPARALFARHGCRSIRKPTIVKFPRDVVEKYRRMTPPKFTFRGAIPSSIRPSRMTAPSL